MAYNVNIDFEDVEMEIKCKVNIKVYGDCFEITKRNRPSCLKSFLSLCILFQSSFDVTLQ